MLTRDPEIPHLHFIALEGNSGVGKSATGKMLARLVGLSSHVPEYNAYMGRLNGRPPAYPPPDRATVTASNEIWPKIDLLRQQSLKLRPILDTSVLSVFAFEFAKAARGIPHDIPDLATRYIQLYDSGQLTEPNAWIFLFAPASTIIDRIRARGGSRVLLKDEKTIAYLDKFRTLFADNYVTPSQALRIDNGSLSIEAVTRIAHDFTCRVLSKKCEQADGLRTFLEDIVTVAGRVDDLAAL